MIAWALCAALHLSIDAGVQLARFPGRCDGVLGLIRWSVA